MAKAKPPNTPRTVRCYHCRHLFEVSWQTMTTSCPKCSKALSVEDVVIKVAHSVRKLQTCGKLVVHKKGRLQAQQIEAHGGVEVEGYLEGNVLSGGPVKIHAKAQWKGDLAAPSVEVELGSTITRGYFVIPDTSVSLPAHTNGSATQG
jgi:hypothetical protein